MNIRLHKNATTTPARRRYIQSSPLSVAKLAAELGVSEDTIRRWRGRDSVEDRPHTAHRLQTTLTPAQEAVVIAVRKTLWLPLDDLLVVVREFIHEGMSRSALHRLLVRHGVFRQPVEACDKHGPNRCPTRPRGAISSWRSIAPPAGYTSPSTPTRARLARGLFCVTCTKPARSGSKGC